MSLNSHPALRPRGHPALRPSGPPARCLTYGACFTRGNQLGGLHAEGRFHPGSSTDPVSLEIATWRMESANRPNLPLLAVILVHVLAQEVGGKDYSPCLLGVVALDAACISGSAKVGHSFQVLVALDPKFASSNLKGHKCT